jgi:hypothetical protein
MGRILCACSVVWLLASSTAGAQQSVLGPPQVSPPPQRALLGFAERPVTEFTTQKDEEKKPNGNGKNGNGKKEEEPPEHMKDNAMLVEEAFNQEKGVAQHIFNWVNFWDRSEGVRRRDFAFAYTMELPIGSQDHQFSFTTPYLTTYEKAEGEPAAQQGDVGDITLNYRYQLLADDDFLWVSPRFGLVLPAGDERLGLGTGQVGYVFNLPISKRGELFDFHFNAGVLYTPNVSVPLATGLDSPRHDLRTYNLGASVYWKPQTNLHLFVEVLALWPEQIDEGGGRDRLTQVFLNPGFRYAICQLEDVEWVVGVGVPIGLTEDTPDIGVFAYMSVEHAFRKKPKECGEE